MKKLSFRKTCYTILLIIGITLLFQWCGNDKQPKVVDSEQEKVEVNDEEKKVEKCSNSQCSTFFYRLQYVIENGIKRDGVDNNGQFITFTENSCYESDKYGHDVKNGCLSFSGKEDGGLTECFIGAAYWGDDCKFVFTHNRKSLHVDTPDGRKIVYYRSMPPNGMTTCSLLRTNDELARQMIFQQAMEQERQRLEELSRNDNFSKNHSVDNSRMCIHCNGTGTITIYHDKTSGFGLEPVYVKCSVCNQYYNINSSAPHSHKCQYCNGTGRK